MEDFLLGISMVCLFVLQRTVNATSMTNTQKQNNNNSFKQTV